LNVFTPAHDWAEDGNGSSKSDPTLAPTEERKLTRAEGKRTKTQKNRRETRESMADEANAGGHKETLDEKLARLGIGKVGNIEVEHVTQAAVIVDRDDVVSDVDAAALMNAVFNQCVPDGHPKHSDTEFRKSFEVAVVVSGIYNGTSERAPFTGYFKVGTDAFKRELIKKALGKRTRQFYRYYADVARVYLLTHPAFCAKNASKWEFSETYAEFAFDFSDYCSSLEENERDYIKTKKAMSTTTATDYEVDSARKAREVKQFQLEQRIHHAKKPVEKRRETRHDEDDSF
jgi:hypothetical protein